MSNDEARRLVGKCLVDGNEVSSCGTGVGMERKEIF